MRKIGYSVGLESTLPRVVDTARSYVEHRQLTTTAWKALVQADWKLKNDSVGDFFNALGILRRTNTSVDILNGLDVHAIILESLGEDHLIGNQMALLCQILESDGEIFCNCLKANFDTKGIETLLKCLIEFKRDKLFQIYQNPQMRTRIAHVVSIERQDTNTGNASAEVKDKAKKLGPLGLKRKGPLALDPIPDVSFSADYFRKVPPRRRDWAASIGLYGPDGLVPGRFDPMIALMATKGCLVSCGAVVLWPFSHEILRLRLNPVVFGSKSLEFWDLVEFGVVGCGGRLTSSITPSNSSEVLEILRRHFNIFRDLNHPKAMLRRELPLTIAYITIAAEILARGGEVPPIPQILEDQKKKGAFLYRSSRNSIGTISFG
ncbi:hypothetical protein FJ981_04570 [Mesorhizobium sp. B1-1-4]|uniref:hypothetical protein n=1 Tax=Mesorhizobium sp. B1-1-4 TaxID=2589980 RepID=UPI001125B315|nr:hypothetical protein [Mesorhizobium sp. B1-1-4]TPN59648.1 hypothetical protein FJ981_04570 [Mesorhizobium sp. B1-1-4]